MTKLECPQKRPDRPTEDSTDVYIYTEGKKFGNILWRFKV